MQRVRDSRVKIYIENLCRGLVFETQIFLRWMDELDVDPVDVIVIVSTNMMSRKGLEINVLYSLS